MRENNLQMPPFPREYSPDFWSFDPEDSVELTCLMPNGIVILLKVSYNATLLDIKADLWEEAPKYPLHGKLHDMSSYVFTCINSMAEREELHDETRRICDVKPTCAVLKIECLGNEPDNKINVQIGHLIGRSVKEFDELNNPEINDFRFQMRKLGDDITQKRLKYTWLEKLYYQFPPRLCPKSKIFPETLDQKKNIKITTRFEDNENSFTFNVSPYIYPNKLLEMILAKRSNVLKIRYDRCNDYVLKVCGQDEYLVGDHQLIQFQYIQDSLSTDVTPIVVTVRVNKVPVTPDNPYESLDNFDHRRMRSTYSTLTWRKRAHKSAWDIQRKFSVTLNAVSGLNCDMRKTNEIGIQVGLFHGGKSLCERLKASIQPINEKNESFFRETLVFDILVCNIPRNAKLCFCIYEVPKSSKLVRTKKGKEYGNNKESITPIAWANTTVYDFKNQLRNGAMTLYMWTFANDLMCEDIFNALGNVVNNPNKSATALTLHLNSFAEDQTIYYPTTEAMINFAQENKSKYISNSIEYNPTNIEHCQKILTENDNLFEVHEQDRKNIWLLKDYWKKQNPEVLPKLLSSIDWDTREVVSDVAALLKDWPKLPPEKALELLDYAYPDQRVRSFAVECLDDVSDEDLLLYLLQLVQAIKHEMYLECDLVKFLIKRALNNQKIGHYLFWHLKSELQVPSVSVRFGLILEAYCRGSQEHMPVLLKQLEFLDKLKNSREHVKNKSKEKAKSNLKDYLTECHIDETVQNIRSPLDPSFRCSKIKLDRCRIMDSKMRPLWIVLQNYDPFGDDVYIIFKDGDDLRQDMLTLQMLKIMDRLWKSEGLDLRLSPYNCISLGDRAGMIEVVLNAETIANIQKDKGVFSATSAFRKGSILAWLRDHNPTESALNKAINEFTLSCAGYCVATYVLGVADRHSDNIMVKKSGQLFHIDFGHILGHFKEKFGIKRERVPFVLTHDFEYVINKGQKTTLEFKIFQEYCEKAFVILRKHGSLILSLCAMMISTGLPELSSEKDLNYIRDTLALSKSEEEALNHFRNKFDEALSNSWKTSLNWASHNLAKNNKA
ncbi:phosphatidylinositol 4,5-bisphosphate 3-kinase catalytic subunit delta isoform [Tribolium castaneum]|uniref:phosphatidylinositol 4,5-bisphosphate 3-kinase catalytic subunit delta isoform n=1 Tax=Tribolium castaneum TaxID=7070 RepID=UPI0030FE44C0